jgi:copper chaperone CopZ
MHCNHCVKHVTEALKSLADVSRIRVDLATGIASFQTRNPIPIDVLERILLEEGYQIKKEESHDESQS